MLIIMNERDQNKIYYAMIHDTGYYFLLPLKIIKIKTILIPKCLTVFEFTFNQDVIIKILRFTEENLKKVMSVLHV